MFERQTIESEAATALAFRVASTFDSQATDYEKVCPLLFCWSLLSASPLSMAQPHTPVTLARYTHIHTHTDTHTDTQTHTNTHTQTLFPTLNVRLTFSLLSKALGRVITAISKYHICKRAPQFVYEAMECLGGNGESSNVHPSPSFVVFVFACGSHCALPSCVCVRVCACVCVPL